MKNNQFARISADHQTVIDELQQIHFMDNEVNEASTSAAAYRLLLRKACVNVQGEHGFDTKLRNYLATPDTDLKDYLNAGEPITAEVFYLVVLQLCGFLPGDDFSMDEPLAAMKEMQLPMLEAVGAWTRAQVLDAWYLLLTTHTKDGQTFLDLLTNQGYFVPFYDLSARQKPLFFNGKSQAVFDTSKLICEVVYVESSVDSDHDGNRDLLKVEIIRPADTENGLKVPALFTASPYNQDTNDEAGAKAMHKVNVPLTEKQPNNLSYKDIAYHDEKMELPDPRSINGETKYAAETFSREYSYTLNDYFLARGFAAVYSAGIGTLDSDGIQTCGNPQQTEATINVIEWLNGKRCAYTNRTDHIAITAWWCNGSVAMTGRSYLGTLATAAATTGVEGLKTIISEAAISSWYGYYREGGLMIAPDGYPGEDADVLAIETMSRMKAAADYHLHIKDYFDMQMKKMARDMERESGNYNTFWDARNYLKKVKNIKCDVLMVHGLNDWNVKPGQVEQLWQALRDVPVTKKIILHQGQHIYINAFRSIDYTDMINLWISHELYGVQNGAKELLPNVIVQDNVIPETWTVYQDWSEPSMARETYHFSEGKLDIASTGYKVVTFKDSLPFDHFKRYAEHLDQWQRDILAEEPNDLSANRLLFKTVPVDKDMIIDGRVRVHVQASSNHSFGMLSFQLVDYGEAKRFNVSPTPIPMRKIGLGYRWREDQLREFTLAKFATPFKMISKGHINLQNRENAWKVDELKPDQFYSIDVDLQPTFHRLAAGHQLGLVVYATDFGMTVRGNQDLRYSLELGNCRLDVPLR
ncbi:Xaa-Pro dipeptidyl-peptidase [Sporolactobacillus shoreicorticis]|uniref:Xaa-Pro dipeptidyl-peptidase n=1 Tax=Sporolactobacillus shoreicorticis TaxID=1923877 RepID=A0ABW5S1M9_9BACL|nr:Xaa-Pro dipeptidyl-peptidase [Sporolactobacillus shoreicorticis]MCO7125375.1 Xaa-Pro dipeptidyl-peptidase [Sporolactobacillus shoreicorticis]